jgi:hypothetical protein
VYIVQRAVIVGSKTEGSEKWTMSSGKKAVDSKHWAMWAVDSVGSNSGQCAINSGQWAVIVSSDSGQ